MTVTFDTRLISFTYFIFFLFYLLIYFLYFEFLNQLWGLWLQRFQTKHNFPFCPMQKPIRPDLKPIRPNLTVSYKGNPAS